MNHPACQSKVLHIFGFYIFFYENSNIFIVKTNDKLEELIKTIEAEAGTAEERQAVSKNPPKMKGGGAKSEPKKGFASFAPHPPKIKSNTSQY